MPTLPNLQTVILEGEMVAYDEETEMIDEYAYVSECAHNLIQKTDT